jgi:sulfite exporter TauE/SafE
MGGLLGSPHCMSMCGPIVLNFANQRSRLLAYQLGRMSSYCIAGALVGAFGEEVLGHERPAWLSGVSLLLIATLLLINGYRAISGKSLHLPMPAWANRASMKFWRALRISKLPKVITAAAAGLLTVLLPCGHLYGFLIGAVATGSATKGAAFMFAFWLGSTPLLSFGGAFLQKILQPRIENGQRWAGVLLLIAGLFSILTFAARTESFAKHSSESHLSEIKDPQDHHANCH